MDSFIFRESHPMGTDQSIRIHSYSAPERHAARRTSGSAEAFPLHDAIFRSWPMTHNMCHSESTALQLVGTHRRRSG